MKKKVKQKKENSERWLLTYADMITLLLALFILLYAMSNIDQDKYEELASSLRKSLGNETSIIEGDSGVIQDGGGKAPIDVTGNESTGAVPTSAAEVTGTPTESKSLATEADMKNLKNIINKILEDMDIKEAIGMVVSERGLTISLANDAFFDSGKAELKDNMKKSLGKIAKLINNVSNSLVVEGFTDNVPVSSSNKFTSNWQLSSTRAVNVVEYLVEDENVDGKRLSAIGYGEYHPIATNDTVEGRQKNRRVDITILYFDEAPN